MTDASTGATPQAQGATVSETVALFDSRQQMVDAVEALRVSGFDRSTISMLANDDEVARMLNDRKDTADLATDPDVPRGAPPDPASIDEARAAAIGIPAYVGIVAASGAVIASGGTLAALAAAASGTGAAGAAIGALLSHKIDQSQAKHVEKQLAAGGLLLWVHTPDEDSRESAREILEKQGGRDIQVVELPAEQ
jgi:hypothetical protein